MKDAFKKALLLGIGAMAATGEKVDSLIDELVAKGEVTAEEGKRILNEYKEKVKSDPNLATKTDLEEIKARLDAIEKKLNNK